jgi:tetratricopeptide (TPR) repeat protein
MTRWLGAVTATLLLLGIAGEGAADQTDERLDALFQRLQTTENASKARVLEGLIWHIWLEVDQDDAERELQQGMAAMSANEYKLAASHFDRLVALAPEFAEGWNKRATLRYLMGDYTGSVADIQHTLALEPRHFGALSGLGLINMAIDDDEGALKAFEAALDVNPHMPGPQHHVELLRERLSEKQGKPI